MKRYNSASESVKAVRIAARTQMYLLTYSKHSLTFPAPKYCLDLEH